MKIVQSFWSGNQTNFTNKCGWLNYKYNWLSWILSCHQLVKYHKEVELYTDRFGYEILIKKLHLPYTKVHIVLDDLNHYDKNLWAIAKIKTFQMQTKPFLHVDGDVFVWESLVDKFKKSNLVTQNVEVTTDYYSNQWKKIYPQLLFLPAEMNEYHGNTKSFACNMGILGGNNLNFIKNFSDKSIEFITKNANCIEGLENVNFNIFFEQVLFYEMTKLSNQNIDFYFDELHLTLEYKGFGDFDKVPNIKYLHLMGKYKGNQFACKAMEMYIMKHYPDAYTNLAKLINETDKNSIEIESLNSQSVAHWITQFDIELKSYQFESDSFLLKRDLYNEGLPNKFDSFLDENQNFWMATLDGFARKTSDEDKNEIDCLVIEQTSGDPTIYALDDIDDVILSTITKPILYFDFIEKIKDCLEEKDLESINEFIGIMNQTLRKYLTLKIISIYN